jgi:hypothetical protein
MKKRPQERAFERAEARMATAKNDSIHQSTFKVREVEADLKRKCGLSLQLRTHLFIVAPVRNWVFIRVWDFPCTLL